MMKPAFSFVISLMVCLSIGGQPITETWPMTHGNPAHTSSAQINISFPLQLTLDAPLIFNRAAGVVVSEDKIFFSCNGNPNTLYAADLFTGDSLWAFEVPNTGGGNQFCPAVAYGVVLSGGQNGPGLYGLDVNTGEVLWLDSIKTLYGRSPAIYDSLAYVASNEGFRCLNIKTGELLWRTEYGTPQFSPGIDSFHVYFNTYGASGGVIYATDRMTGDVIWSTESVSTGHFSSFHLDDSLLYHGYEDTLTTFNKMNGDVVWQASLDSNEVIYLDGMAALSDSFLVTKTRIGGGDLNHYRIIERATGVTRNRYSTIPWQWSAPVLINGYLVECGPNQILFRDIMTGDSVYGLSNLTFGGAPAQPLAVNDRIVLVSDAGRINILQSKPSLILPVSNRVDAKLFPNPTAEMVFVQLNLEEASTVVLNTYSLNGALINQKDYGYLGQGDHTLTHSVRGLASGVYILQIKTGRGVLSKKVVVE